MRYTQIKSTVNSPLYEKRNACLSRRSFLLAAACLPILAAAGGMAGCSEESTSASDSTEGNSTSSAQQGQSEIEGSWYAKVDILDEEFYADYIEVMLDLLSDGTGTLGFAMHEISSETGGEEILLATEGITWNQQEDSLTLNVLAEDDYGKYGKDVSLGFSDGNFSSDSWFDLLGAFFESTEDVSWPSSIDDIDDSTRDKMNITPLSRTDRSLQDKLNDIVSLKQDGGDYADSDIVGCWKHDGDEGEWDLVFGFGSDGRGYEKVSADPSDTDGRAFDCYSYPAYWSEDSNGEVSFSFFSPLETPSFTFEHSNGQLVCVKGYGDTQIQLSKI